MNRRNAEIFKSMLAEKIGILLLVAFVSGPVFSLLGALGSFKDFIHSYLAAFYFYFTISTGALFILLIHHIIGIKWTIPLRRTFENVAASITSMSPLFLPILFSTPTLYPQPNANPLFNKYTFIAVSILVLCSLTTLALLLRSYSITADSRRPTDLSDKMKRLALAGIIIYPLSITAAAYYWIMGLEYPWFSGIFGVYHFSASVQAALAVIGLIMLAITKNPTPNNPIGDGQWRNLSFLIFAFTLIHTYTSYSQYMLILSPSLPHETIWYSKRIQNGWLPVWLAIFLLRIALPFSLLLWKRFKLNRQLFALVCSSILLGNLLEIYINVIPAPEPDIQPFKMFFTMLGPTLFSGSIFAASIWRYFKLNSTFPLTESESALQPDISPISGGAIYENQHPDI
ncbi:MAG: hypothetical protein ACP5K7_08245 [Verrucomicrobiia bacterium]